MGGGVGGSGLKGHRLTVLTEIYQIFLIPLKECFPICCMPLGQFPEASHVCFL